MFNIKWLSPIYWISFSIIKASIMKSKVSWEQIVWKIEKFLKIITPKETKLNTVEDLPIVLLFYDHPINYIETAYEEHNWRFLMKIWRSPNSL